MVLSAIALAQPLVTAIFIGIYGLIEGFTGSVDVFNCWTSFIFLVGLLIGVAFDAAIVSARACGFDAVSFFISTCLVLLNYVKQKSSRP